MLFEPPINLQAFIRIEFIAVWAVYLLTTARFYVGLLQLEAYRLDTLWAYIKEELGIRVLWFFSLDLAVLAVLSWLIAGYYFSDLFLLGISAYFLWRAFAITKQGFFRVSVPVTYSARYLMSYAGAIGLLWCGVVLWKMSGFSVALIVIAAFVPVAVLISVFGFAPFFWMVKKRTVHKAKLLLQSHSLKVIGITGSYGKTSTKAFLSTLLSLKYKTAYTPENTNEQYAIARYILGEDWTNKEIFVVEMGAYQRGEIAATCDLVDPDFGIITGIGNQHLALFGSMENIVSAKSELLSSLPANGLAFLPADDATFSTLVKATQVKVIKVGYGADCEIWADEISETTSGVSFTLHVLDEAAVRVFVPVLGQHFVRNLLLAIGAAFHMGLSLDQIVVRLGEIVCPKTVLRKRTGTGDMVILDDRYSASTAGFTTGLHALRLFGDRKKIVVTPGLKQLGRDMNREQVRLIKQALTVADEVILTKRVSLNSELYQNPKLQVAQSVSKALELLGQLTNEHAVILFEGRSPQILMDHFLAEGHA